MNRFIVLSGPSCIGKGPLYRALQKFYPGLSSKLHYLVCYDSRPPRPGETDGVDFYFRTRDFIENLRGKEDHLVIEYRGDLLAVDFSEIRKSLRQSDVFFEGNPIVGRKLLDFCKKEDIENLSIFLSPLSMEEIRYLKAPERSINLEDFVTDVMRRKLLKRTRKQKTILSAKDLDNIEVRASRAFSEMKLAYLFDYVIPNHDGEDSDNWDAFYYPIADARKTLLSLAAILSGEKGSRCEKWPQNLLP
jgi:guanylate kinase